MRGYLHNAIAEEHVAPDGSPLDTGDAVAAGCHWRAEYTAERRREAEAALSMAGIAKAKITQMNFTDQRVSFGIAELALKLVSFAERERPEVRLTHAYEGGHPDHDAVAFACHAARWIQARRSSATADRIHRLSRV